MADTLDQIYMNTSLGETELTDGDHTLLTTDANTSYVVKDMNLSGDFAMLNAGSHLELNGFDVGSITSNATGSLIIPPSSTLKIKTGSTYPVTYEQTEAIGLDNSNIAYIERTINKKGSTTVLDTPLSITSRTGLSGGAVTDIINIDYNVADDGNGYWYTSQHDGNSAQQAHYVGQVSGSGQLDYRNYSALGTGRMLNGDYIGYASVSNDMYVKDLDGYPTATLISNPGLTTWSSSMSPYPSSSYPRHFFALDHVWYMPTSSYTSQFYAVNLNNGSFKSYSSVSTIAYPTSPYHMCVSHDESDDSIYVWRPDGTNHFEVTKLNDTLTTLLADTGSGSRSHTNQSRVALPTAITSSQSIKGQPVAVSGGGIRYMNTSNEYVSIYPDGTEHTPSFTKTSITIGGASRSLQYYKQSTRVLSAAEIAANSNISQPVFGIQLLGIKSET